MESSQILLMHPGRRDSGAITSGCTVCCSKWACFVAKFIAIPSACVYLVRRGVLGLMVPAGVLRPASVMKRIAGTANVTGQRVDWFFSCSSWSG